MAPGPEVIVNIDRLRAFAGGLRAEVGQLRHRGLSEMAP